MKKTFLSLLLIGGVFSAIAGTDFKPEHSSPYFAFSTETNVSQAQTTVPGSSTANTEKKCRTDANKNKKAINFEPTDFGEIDSPGKNNIFEGSSIFRKCDNLSFGTMKDLYRNGSSSRNSDAVTWKENIEYACECKNSPDEKQKCITNGANLAARCESVAFLINSYDRDWYDEQQNKPVKKESSARMPTQNVNGQSATQALAAANAFKCTSAGIETLDYDACVKFVTQLEVIEAVQTVGTQTQEVIYKGKIADTTTKYMNEKNTATGALKAQSDSLKMGQDMYEQRTAIDATKLAYLYSVYKEMPDESDVKSRCNQMRSDIPITENKKVTKEDCESVVLPKGFAIFSNQAQKDAMKRKLITIATEAGSNLILANLLGRRAKDVDNMIAKVDEFKPIDPTIVTEDEAQSTFCKLNQGHPSCALDGLERTFDTIDGNVINFGGTGTGTTYSEKGKLADSATNASSNAVGGSGKGATPVGSIIASANKNNSIEGSTGASVKTSGTGSSSGGGGGGASGGGLGGGGGSSGSGGGGGEVSNGTGMPKAAYTGGAGGVSVMGGFGIKNKKNDGSGEDNPFGKLFGKEGPKTNGLLNFRDLASTKVGGKNDNIFDMISKRYETVAADKRLIEYELAK